MRHLYLLLCVFPLILQAQLETPPASPPTVLQQQIGLTNFTITYSRPSLKGRVIFGELIPFDQVWRTGANEATLIEFDQAIQIGEQHIPAGTYSVFTIPGKQEWTFVLNSVTESWGARAYEPENDVIRIPIKPQTLTERIETMALRWMNLTYTSADLAIEWENTRIKIPISLSTHQQVDQSIAENLDDEASGSEYYRAARYYLDNELDLTKAKTWMDRRMELDGEQFGVMRYQALIEYQLGETEQARKTMERSLELAKQAPNEHYVRMNTQTLKEWIKKSASLSAQDILQRSIQYHDPEGTWKSGQFQFKLYESRPGGGYRISDLLMNQEEHSFTLKQRRGRDLLYRYRKGEECIVQLNGSTDISDEQAQQYRLRCSDNELYQNYYEYLWGLPMKLEDPGTIIDSEAYQVNFFGEELYQIRVTYDDAVGSDIWYFYFDPTSYALRGYRFYHDEAANDGEYILLDGEAQVGTIRIPANRHWYTHGDRRYLGSDEIIGH